MTQGKIKWCNSPSCKACNLVENKEDKMKPDENTTESTDTQDAFWLVWTPQGGHPKHKHGIRESAEKEAERLAKQHPEKEFYVLKCVSKTFVESKINKVNYE